MSPPTVAFGVELRRGRGSRWLCAVESTNAPLTCQFRHADRLGSPWRRANTPRSLNEHVRNASASTRCNSKSGDNWYVNSRARAGADLLLSVTLEALAVPPLAAFLHGSPVFNDFVAGRSDIDVLIVVEQQINASSVDPVLGAIAVARVTPNADVRVVTRDAAAAPTNPPMLELGVALRHQSNAPAQLETLQGYERDLLIEYSMCRAHGIPLIGPPAREVIGAIPRGWVLQVGDAQLADWEALPFEGRYAELMAFTACRVWLFASEDRHASKTEAAQWVLRQAPELEAVKSALARRSMGSRVRLSEQAVRDLMARARSVVATEGV